MRSDVNAATERAAEEILNPRLTGADILASQLAAHGATRAFGIPGGEVLEVVAALQRSGVTFHLAKHENAAGFIAEGFWHGSGSLPILVVTLGPGIANAVTAIAHAHQDRVPLIVISGCVDAITAETYTHQIFDHQAVLRPLVKASFRVAAGTEAIVVEKAIAIARSGRPGPVHIDMPISVAERPATSERLPTARQIELSTPRDLSYARELIATATHPLVIAGLDLVNQSGAASLRQFIAATGAPVLTTYKGKGLIPEADPSVIGGVGLSPKADAVVKPLIEAADLIILAGYDPIEMREGWRQPWSSEKNVIDIVAQYMPHGMHKATLTLEGHVPTILSSLMTGVARRPLWPDGMPDRVRRNLRSAFTSPGRWGPHAVFEVMRELAPAGTVSTADSGAHRILLSQMWRCDGPRQLLQSTGLCTMGCAVPLAAGAALASGRSTLCFVGDGGLEMTLGELATLRDLSVPVVIVVLVDAALSLIALKQSRQGHARVGVDFGTTDFASVARAAGGYGANLRDVESLRREAHEAFQRKGFSVLACAIDADAYQGAF